MRRRRGEALFNRPFAQMAGRSCASCHIPDSFFTDSRAHNIGSGGESYAGALDGAYDTPTLLGHRPHRALLPRRLAAEPRATWWRGSTTASGSG